MAGAPWPHLSERRSPPGALPALEGAAVRPHDAGMATPPSSPDSVNDEPQGAVTPHAIAAPRSEDETATVAETVQTAPGTRHHPHPPLPDSDLVSSPSNVALRSSSGRPATRKPVDREPAASP